ncbi:type II toxin-antitoxin system HipA family toxin [Moraxella osloensis]|uniref:Type II toxin-antitoxin system HipA family toxin n=1 Tax=Faucicola osloensis TaxID=34062 RepID=A0AAW6TLF9_FAUOS|nr:type II toxin-antitoxin system HipA family toxin [Moraxella osloensis]MDI4510959.1 type II toxin-antitoxin system HipA family toxin [Moraxella osloensis]
MTKVRVLKLSLHNRLVGYLAGFDNGKNVLTFAQEFALDNNRPTLSLTTRPDFPFADRRLMEQWVHRQKINPILSNLLPEGALRLLLTQGLKIHPDNEFELLAYLGRDLPGALVVESIEPEAIPHYIFDIANGRESATLLPTSDLLPIYAHFSLAGVQMKFSMTHQRGRFTLPNTAKNSDLGDWIIKTPSAVHQGVAENEYSMMRLAKMAGVDIPNIKLVDLEQLDNLPTLHLPNEPYAYAIERFDRDKVIENHATMNVSRIHSEDFAQILGKYPHDKYQGGNYNQIAQILYQYSQDGLADIKQLARRLLINILLGNGDAHLKNWSVIYPDGFHLRLSPAYDIVFTKAYIANETNLALNLGKRKNWYQIELTDFEYWAKKADIPWRVVKSELAEMLSIARTEWRNTLKNLPMLDNQKNLLLEHWRQLPSDFRI